jgi:hypothetical protein
MVIKIGLVFGICCIGVLLYLAYLGAWRQVRIVEREDGPFLFVYEEVQGTNQQRIGAVTLELQGRLRSVGVPAEGPFDVFQPPGTQLPNEIGFVIPEREGAKLTSLKELSRRVIPRQRYMVTEFPLRNRLSFFVGYFKVDPAFAEYRKQHSYDSALAIARNNGKTITYLQPAIPIDRKAAL